jgi:O-methyltransferase
MNLEELKKELLGQRGTAAVRPPSFGSDEITMLPRKTLQNIEDCIRAVVSEDVKGDFVETGIWRGGACILATAVLKDLDEDRKVWGFDSFEGLPMGNAEKYPADAGDRHHAMAGLAVSLEEVKTNFERFNLLDDNVLLVKGLFKDTMPVNTVGKIAVLRLDGDMYESTIEVLEHLYPKLEKGGFCIIDDYGLGPCKLAVEHYRSQHGIEDPIVLIDNPPAFPSIFWKKT